MQGLQGIPLASTVTAYVNHWPREIFEPEVVVVPKPKEAKAEEPAPHPGSYKPVELESHEDFAVRLRKR